jgi:hypothetical protein
VAALRTSIAFGFGQAFRADTQRVFFWIRSRTRPFLHFFGFLFLAEAEAWRSEGTLPREGGASKRRDRILVPMRRLAALLAVLATFAATATAEAKQLVRYNVGGGLAGLSGQLIVAGDGTARQSGNRRSDDHRFTLSAKQLSALRRDLKRARFKTLKRTYQPKYVVNDGVGQSVTYKGRSVSVYTGAKYPDRLQRLLRRLGRLMR